MAEDFKPIGELLGEQPNESPKREFLRSKSGDPDYNPLKDAAAFHVWPGATFVGDNRYRTRDGFLVDRNGSLRDMDACPECGSLHGEYRFKVPVEKLDPREPQRWTYCRRCISPEERDELHMLAANPDAYDEMIARRKALRGRPVSSGKRW